MLLICSKIDASIGPCLPRADDFPVVSLEVTSELEPEGESEGGDDSGKGGRGGGG